MCPAANSSARAHVDEHDVAAAQPLDQLVAADRLDVLAEVVARRALDLGQPGDRGVAQRQPERAAPRRRRARSARCVPSRARVTMPAACSACRCWEVFAVDCSLARASSSTVRGAWASRSSSSSRRGLANALPISAIASNSASFCARELHPLLFNRSLDSLSSR